ncbi:hypothetical protein V8E54_014843 [Elaphomyces granulatus]
MSLSLRRRRHHTKPGGIGCSRSGHINGTCKKVFTTACARKGHIPYRGACVGRRVIRNGDKLKEHCTRFEPNCRYHNWIPKGPIKDWLILDCRHSRPKRSTKAIATDIDAASQLIAP